MRVIGLAAVCGFLIGCGSAATKIGLAPTPVAQVFFGGDWNFPMVSTSNSGSVLSLGGTVTSTGKRVSGTLFVIGNKGEGATNLPCFAILQPIAFSGALDDLGKFSLVSSPSDNQVITIAGQLSADSLTATGTYSVSTLDRSQATCDKEDAGSFQGTQMQAVSGTYHGTLTPSQLNGSSTGAQPLQATLSLTQTSTPDAFGRLHVSGIMKVDGWNCMTQASVDTTGDGTTDPSTFLEGDLALFKMPLDDIGQVTFGTNVVLAPDGKSLQFALFYIHGGSCNNVSGSASFTQSPS